MTYTTPETHEYILDNLNKSSMYSGVVKGVGPRYCPSIEDNIVRFQDKPRQSIILGARITGVRYHLPTRILYITSKRYPRTYGSFITRLRKCSN